MQASAPAVQAPAHAMQAPAHAMQAPAHAMPTNRWRVPWRLLQSTRHSACHKAHAQHLPSKSTRQLLSVCPSVCPSVRGSAGEDGTVGPAERGRACAQAYRPGDRVGSAGAGSRQANSRAKRKRRIQSDELKEHIHREKLDGLAQTATTELEELHCAQHRYCQQRGVVPARSRDEYVEETATPRGGDDMADRGGAIRGRRIALWSGPRPLTPVFNFIFWYSNFMYFN